MRAVSCLLFLSTLFFASLVSRPTLADPPAGRPQLPAPAQRGGLCPGILPCAESGPLAAHLRFSVELWPDGGQFAAGGGVALSFGLAHWAELGVSLAGRGHDGWRSGTVAVWGRLTPPVLSNLGRRGFLSLGGWLLAETAPPELDPQGHLYLDTETYGACADALGPILSGTLYAAFQTADAGQYRGLEAGAGLWVTLSASTGVQIGSELYLRAGQHTGDPGQLSLFGALSIRMFGEGGIESSFAHVRPFAGGGPWVALAQFGTSYGPAYKRPPRVGPTLYDELQQWANAQRLKREGVALRMPEVAPLGLPAPSLSGANCVFSHVRMPCVAGMAWGLGLQYQVPPVEVEAAEVEPAKEELPGRPSRSAKEWVAERPPPGSRPRPGDAIRVPYSPEPPLPPWGRGVPLSYPTMGMPRGADGEPLPTPPVRVGSPSLPPVRVRPGSPSTPTQAVSGAAARGGAGPVRQGQKGVADHLREEEAAGHRVKGEEVTIKTPLGRRRTDVLIEETSGNVRAVEVKTGKSPYTPEQQAKDRWIETHGGVAVGKNARKAGVAGPIRVKTDLVRRP